MAEPRVAVLLDRWRRGHGGLERYLERVLPALAQQAEVWLLARAAEREPPPCVRARAVAPPWPWPRPWRDRADAAQLLRAARELAPQAVWSVRAIPYPGGVYQPHGGCAPALRRARGRGGWKARALERLEAETLRACRRVLAVSPKVARELAAYHPQLDVVLLPPPLPELEPYRPRPLSEPKQVLFCGRDARLKGAPEALQWFRRLRRRWPDASLRMWSASAAHLERVLGSSAAALRGEGVLLHGWDGGFAAALRAGDLLLHPTRYDACSLVCLEAAGLGVPVVTTAANGLSELIGAPLLATAAPGDDDALLAAAAAAFALEETARAAALGAVRAEFALARHVRSLAAALL